MASFKPSLARASTMEITADEGIGFLKASQKLSLLQFQGLIDDEETSTPRNNSISSTVMEAESFLGEYKPIDGASTRFQRHLIEEEEKEEKEEEDEGNASPPKKLKLPKSNTMTATTEEGKHILGKHKFGATRRETTRKRAKKTNPSLRTSKTMVRTLEEAKYVLGPNASTCKLTLTPRRRKIKSPSLKSSLKRLSSMQNTANDGQAYLNRIGFSLTN